jgi:Envelope integrity protein A
VVPFFRTVEGWSSTLSLWGLPNGYVLGEEAGGAFIGGLRYGDGMLYTKNAGDARVYWQGRRLVLTTVPTARAPHGVGRWAVDRQSRSAWISYRRSVSGLGGDDGDAAHTHDQHHGDIDKP